MNQACLDEKQETERVYGERHPTKMRRSRVAGVHFGKKDINKLAGGDALTGHTRSHPEHEG